MNTESVVEIASAVAPKTCPSMRVQRTWRISAAAPERKKQIATSTRRDENTERAESTDRGKSQKESFTTEARRHGGTEAQRIIWESYSGPAPKMIFGPARCSPCLRGEESVRDFRSLRELYGRQTAVLHHQLPRHALREMRVVRHQHHGQPGLPVHLVDQIVDPAGGRLVEVAGRLVG